jgi:DNA-binding NarL/FixJ family response regulator
MERPIRILLVEDNDVYRDSLELLLGLEDGIEVLGGIADGAEAAATCARLRADVVLMDFRLPGLDGAEATAAVLDACPGSAVVCLTAEATDVEDAAVRAAGAAGLVRKGGPIAELLTAVRQAAAGRE